MYDTDDTTAHEPTEKRSLRFATDLEADVLLTDWTALRVHRVIFDETESQFALRGTTKQRRTVSTYRV